MLRIELSRIICLCSIDLNIKRYNWCEHTIPRDDNARCKQTCGPFIRNIKWITKTMCKRQRESNIYFIIWMEIDTCCYRNTIQCKKNKIPSKILEQRHAPFDATDKIKWNTRVYTPRNAIISLISNLLSSIYLFFSPFFRTFEHWQAPAAPVLMLSLCIGFLCFISFNLWRNVLFMSSLFLFNIVYFFSHGSPAIQFVFYDPYISFLRRNCKFSHTKHSLSLTSNSISTMLYCFHFEWCQ